MSAPQPKAGSYAYSSAQAMSDFRRIEAMLQEAQAGRSPAPEDIAAVRIIVGRMPEPTRSQLRAACADAEARGMPSWAKADRLQREAMRRAKLAEWAR